MAGEGRAGPGQELAGVPEPRERQRWRAARLLPATGAGHASLSKSRLTCRTGVWSSQVGATQVSEKWEGEGSRGRRPSPRRGVKQPREEPRIALAPKGGRPVDATPGGLPGASGVSTEGLFPGVGPTRTGGDSDHCAAHVPPAPAVLVKPKSRGRGVSALQPAGLQAPVASCP